MLVFWIFGCAAIFTNFGESRRFDDILGNFVIDATSSIYLPSTVSALLCFDDVDGFRFSRQLSRHRVMHDIWKLREGLDAARFASRISTQNFFVVDLDCPGALEILVEASQKRMFIAPAKWLIIQDLRSAMKSNDKYDIENVIENDDLSWIDEKFGNFTIFPDSEMIIGRRIDDHLFRVLSPYRPSPQRGLIIEDRGYWTDRGGLFLRDRYVTSRRRMDLRQTELKSCLVITNPDSLNHLEDYRDKHVDAVTKVNYPWILHLARRMNATVNFTWRDSWGYRDKNGSWSGMIDLLNRREVDIGGTATFLTTERIGVVDYVQLYTPTGSKFLFRRPPLSYVSNLFTLPFVRSVWIAIGIFLVVVIGLLYMAMKWEYNVRLESPQPQWSGNIDQDPSFSDNLLIVIGAVSQQGFSYEAREVPARIIVLMLLIAALSLYASYTANIVALLQSTARTINTVEDLLNSPLKVGVYDIVYNRYYFKAMQDPVRKKFYENLIMGKKNIWMNLEEGIQRVRKGLFAFHVEFGAGYQVIQETFEEDEKCGIHEIDYLKMLSPLLAVQHQSPYLEIFRVGGLWIRETGLQYRDISRLYTDKPVCNGHNSFLSVGVIECYAAFMTMGCGIGLTLAILLLEIIWHKWTTSGSTDDASLTELNID